MKTLDVTGLVGIPHAEADCWALAVRALERLGVHVPADPAEVLRHEVEWAVKTSVPYRAGDVLVIRDMGGGQHVAVCVDPLTMLHSTAASGSVLCSIATFARAKLIIRAARPLALVPPGVRS